VPTGLGDLRIGLRALWRHPALPAIVLVPLALAIATSAALFSIVDGLLFRPLPFEKPDELVAIDFRKVGGQIAELSYRRELAPEREALRAAVESSVTGGSQVGLASFFDLRVAQDAGIEATGVDSRFFRVLGLTPLVGADFSPEDELSPAAVTRDSVIPLPVIIGYGLWQRAFGGSAEVLGVHDLAGRRVRIVGVMGPGVKFPGETNLWAPIRSDRNRPPTYLD
jgi:hypothetical protein